ncbi:DegT/DnrJ/EryC1/StrS family aminotransferase [Flavisolibacter ginsenosidimutans]|uniref:DegT/DnrJ/EryC1/StrS family aminotransferase n=1 Tax=Flavisolibacter ginsenosidimutans TaxID=661481 RepID=A0A5B8UFI0_9BACT|nr:DegT/DnrJ/EryC1/StrS family aminotransferase [Flavisolibacter ginsenosidimutans]QEC54889.1 DegT/DnrJ/EryC1/StrS family aminotransferase [Flavisolibacter ginsenosidimutans]
MNIPFVDLRAQYHSIKENIDTAIQDVIEKTAFIGGHYVKEFEKKFAELYGVKHVISCANGTDSLYIIMKMLGIGKGDEVITVANSWISSAETIGQTGAKPVFVDVDPDYFSIDDSKIEAVVTPQTKAIVLVHLQGQACDLDKIEALCKKHSISLIEDCAQSHFSEFNGRRVGTVGIAGSFSFYPGKNLGAYGDAGCIITNDDEMASRFRMYANHGALIKHKHEIEGINSRMDGLQASILTAKLPFILQWTEQRIENAKRYDRYLDGISEIQRPKVRPNSRHTYHLYVIKAQKRDALMEFLKQHGIETAIHYPTALPNLKAYAYLGNPPGNFPVATALQDQILSLPMYPELTEDQIKYTAETIKAFYKA